MDGLLSVLNLYGYIEKGNPAVGGVVLFDRLSPLSRGKAEGSALLAHFVRQFTRQNPFLKEGVLDSLRTFVEKIVAPFSKSS